MELKLYVDLFTVGVNITLSTAQMLSASQLKSPHGSDFWAAFFLGFGVAHRYPAKHLPINCLLGLFTARVVYHVVCYAVINNFKRVSVILHCGLLDFTFFCSYHYTQAS